MLRCNEKIASVLASQSIFTTHELFYEYERLYERALLEYKKVKSDYADYPELCIKAGEVPKKFEMLDLIVTMKAAAMEDEKITFRCSGSLEEDLGMKAFDICGIFAGALDGAIEECKTDKDSAIDMVISENETSRIIKISNSFNGDPDRAFSGKINRSCIKAYGGTVKTSVKDNISELVLTFPRIVRREAVNV